jgi:hypothetical protein
LSAVLRKSGMLCCVKHLEQVMISSASKRNEELPIFVPQELQIGSIGYNSIV